MTDIVGSTLAALLPFAPANAGSHVSLLVAVAALLVIWLAGWHRALQPSVGRAHRYRVLLLAAVLPLFGALVYAPWPFYILVYAFPCLAAGALLFGQATSSLWTARGVSRVVGLAGVTVTLSFSIAQAANEAIRTRTLQKAFGETVERVAEFRGIDSVLVAVSNDQFDPRGNFGPRFWFYARALGVPWPGVRDIACDEASHLTPARALILRLNIMCDDGPRSAQSIIYPHRRFIWPDPRPRPDTVRVDLITPLLGGSRP